MKREKGCLSRQTSLELEHFLIIVPTKEIESPLKVQVKRKRDEGNGERNEIEETNISGAEK